MIFFCHVKIFRVFLFLFEKLKNPKTKQNKNTIVFMQIPYRKNINVSLFLLAIHTIYEQSHLAVSEIGYHSIAIDFANLRHSLHRRSEVRYKAAKPSTLSYKCGNLLQQLKRRKIRN